MTLREYERKCALLVLAGKRCEACMERPVDWYVRTRPTWGVFAWVNPSLRVPVKDIKSCNSITGECPLVLTNAEARDVWRRLKRRHKR